MTGIRIETDSLGPIEVAADRLWGAQTQRSLLYFSIGHERMPPEMIGAYAVLKQAAATANQQLGHLAPDLHALIKTACAEIEAGQHNEMSPLHVWMTGGSTPFNMMVNEVISKLTKIAHDIRSLAAARAPDRANCSCRRTSLARRSCPARSTPHRRKR